MATWKEWLRNNLLLLLTIASVVVGVIIGSVGRKAEPSRSTIELIAFPGELFMRMLQMAVLPLVTSSIMTGIITVSVIAGIILGKMKERGKTLIECLSVVDNITMKLIMLVMWYSPVGIASLIAGKMLEMVDIWKTLSALAFYMITVITGFLIQMFIIQPLLYFLFTRNNPITFMRGLIQVWLTAFVTASSAATLPVTIRCCERNLEIDRRITRFVLPVGATVNMNGEALYEAVTAIFVAQLTGWELSALRLIIISLIATLCSIGAAAVPSSGVVTVVIVLNALGLGTQHVAMIFAIDWFIDRVRTSVNVIGDAFAAGVVYHYCRKVLQNLGTVQGSTEAIPERTDAIREETAIASVSSEEQTAMNVEEPAADKTVSGSVDEHSYRPEGNDILTPSSESRQNLKP